MESPAHLDYGLYARVILWCYLLHCPLFCSSMEAIRLCFRYQWFGLSPSGSLSGLSVPSLFGTMYVLSENRLIVERFGSDTKFALGSLETVWEDPTAMNGIYVMTNGGLFAFSGKNCRNKKLGVFEAYATDKKRSVVLRFPNDILVVTPEDPTAFVKAVKAGMTVHRKSSDN